MSEYDELVTGGQPLGGNEYDVLLFEEQKQNRQRLRASVNGALKANPDQTAKARQLAQTTGVPAPVVERNLRDVEHRARVNEYDALLEKSPAVARKLQDPDFAKLAHDDVGVLTQVERAVKAGLAGAAQATLNLAESIFRTPEAVGRISKAGEQAAGLPWWSNPLGQLDDAMRLLSGAGAASPTNVADKIGEAQKILAENPDTFGETFQRLAQKGQAADAAFQSGLKGDFSPILDIVTDPEAWAGFIGQAAPSLAMAWQSGGSLPFLAWLEGLDAAGTAAEFEQRTGQKISDADFAQAVAQAASINAVLEKTGLGQVIGGAARGTLPGFMRGTLGEGTTEALQQFNTNLAAFLSYNPEQTLSEGVLGSVMGGAGVGGPAGALASVAARVQEKQQQDVQRVQKAQGDAAALDETVKAAAGSKLLARAPDAFRDAVDAMLGDEAPDVHIGAQDAQAFFQSRPEIIETVRQLMPEVAQSITDALATGADVVVPKADYITYFGQYHQELREVLRNGLDGMTLREAAEWQTTQGEQFRAEAEKALEEHVADSAFQGGAQQVYDNVLGQLNNAARFTEDVNKAYATLVRDFYVTQGNRLRMSPSEVYQKHPLRIQAENVAGPQLEQNATVVDTPEFKNWFGDSKVVDEQGRPLVVYHGTKTDFEQYDPKKAGASDDGLAGKAFYFTYNPEEASSYAERETFGAGDAPNVQPVYISLRNPFVITQGVLPDGRTLKELHGGIGVNAKGGAALRKLAADGGHDGVIWVSRDGSVRHVAAFHPEQIKSAIGNRGAFDPNDPNILNQFAALRQSARGAFSPETNTITLLKNADLSTFLHELGHFFLEVQTGIAAQPDAPPQVRADMDAVLKWFGVENLPEVSALERWQGMTLDEKRPYHEQFARGFEAYLFEGQAPSLELRSMFQRFRAWLTRVYASLQSLNVTLTDEVRSVMDRMLATDAQVKAAQDARRYLPLFASPEDAGMTPEEFAEYQALGSEATAEATEELQRRSLRDMQWLSNAKSKVLRELQRRAGALRRETRMEVAREVWGQPVYRAWQFLTSDAPPEAKPKANPNIDPTRDSLFVAIAKLGGIDRDAARREWGVDPAARPAGVFGKPVLRAKGGKLPGEMEELLTQFGYFTLDAHGRPVLHALEEAFYDELGGVKRYSAQADYDFLLADAPGAQDILAHMGGRLNTANVEALLGEGADLERLRRRRMLRKDGLDPEIVAEAFGFGSGDELVRALVEADTPKVTIEALTDQRMLERHGDLYDERSRARAADEAVHNSTRIRFVATELRALAKATGQRMVLVSAAKDYAEQAIARKKVAQIKPAQYAASEARSARDAEKALRSGNTAEAAAHKRTQLLNGYMYKAAAEGISEAEKAVAYLKRFDKDSIRKNLDPDYRDQIDTLLERFDLRKGTSLKDIARRKSLAEWIESQRAQGFEPVLDERLVNDAVRTSYKELSLEQLRGLRDTVKNIEHLGKLKNTLLTAAERREFDAAVAEAERSIRDNANRKVEDRIERNTWLDRAREGKDEFFAMHRKLASMAREMDGGQDNGVMWDLFIRPANECGVKEAVEREKATMALTQLFKPIAKGGSLRAKRVVPGTNISLSREGRLMVALNWGNADNRKRLLEGGDGWTPADVQAILDTLTREDWGFVQGVWDFIDSYWPQIAEKERRVSGLTPEKVQPIAVQTQYGEYRGGYFPIKYDPLRSSRAEADSMAEVVKQAMQGLYTRATTRRGHTKARAESVTDRPLRKDFGVIFEHVDQVAHDLAWHEYLIDANRLLRATAIDRAIRDHYGPQTLRAIRKTLDDIAAGDIPAQNAFERSINHLRNGTSIAGMGWNLGTALLQPLGLTQSMVRIGPKWVARGLAAWVGDAARMENTVARIYEKSNFMRLRGKTMQREISEIRNRVTAGGKLAPVKETYFWLIQKAQMIADVPTWLGAYEKAVAKGEHEARAVELADQAVLDAQGGGQIKDLAHIQRGGPLLKLWTNFYSYFNVTYNLTAESYRRTNFRHPLEVGRFAVDMFLLYTAPALLAAAMQEAIKNDCDGDEECLARKLAGAQASYMLGTVVGLREVGSVVQGYYGYSGPAGTRFFSEIGKVVQQSEQGEVDAALLKSINSSAGILFHYPSGQVQRTVEGVASVADGDIEGPRALIAPVFGPPKNP